MAYKTKYKTQNPSKYIGNPTNIICRSLWERRVCKYLDENINVVRWGSEELIIPYYSPVDRKMHRYYPDFLIKLNRKDGTKKTMVIEIKPKRETKAPKKKSRITPRYLNEMKTWSVNEAKWKYANEFCKDKNWEFKILTEDYKALLNGS